MSKDVTIMSSNGNFHVDDSGKVIDANINGDWHWPKEDIPVRFDFDEFRMFWAEDPAKISYIDILDLGYWTKKGAYIDPDSTWRKDAMEMNNARDAQGKCADCLESAIGLRDAGVLVESSDNGIHWASLPNGVDNGIDIIASLGICEKTKTFTLSMIVKNDDVLVFAEITPGLHDILEIKKVICENLEKAMPSPEQNSPRA